MTNRKALNIACVILILLGAWVVLTPKSAPTDVDACMSAYSDASTDVAYAMCKQAYPEEK